MPSRPNLRGHLPPALSFLIRPLPKPPMEALLSRLTANVLARAPDLLQRLGSTANVPIAVVPEDLPHAFVLTLNQRAPRIEIREKADIADAEAIVSGPILLLLGLIDGTFDGDALFFSRDLKIEGRMDHVLALRNTLEEADLHPAEFAGLSGAPADCVNRLAKDLLGLARRLSGMQRSTAPQDGPLPR